MLVSSDDTAKWLEDALKSGIKLITHENRDIKRRLTELKILIEKAENEDSKCGERQKQLKESMKNLKINPAIYHGGDLEGKEPLCFHQFNKFVRHRSVVVCSLVSNRH